MAHLAKADAREQKLVLADKLANMRAIARDDAKYGEDLWQRFKRGRNIQGLDTKKNEAEVERLTALADELAG